MSSIINKRQQARNERILQDLLKSVAGNDRCADCGTKNPAWASWSLGVFLCIRCASLHRKLGTHISKVKSISMDSWTSDQIDNMRANGNIKSNTYYNPDPSKHPVPLSTEDSVGVLERYIRNKYEFQLFRRGDTAPQTSSTSSTSSGASSFGASVSNNLPSSSSSNASFNSRTTQRTPTFSSTRLTTFRSTSPSQKKATQVLGVSSIPYTDGTTTPTVQFPHGMVQAPPAVKYEDQLKSLREMGFKDDKQILQTLILTDGKILESVDHLVRLNGGTHPTPSGISIQKSGGSSQNPFEALDRELPPLPPGAVEVGGISPGLKPTIYSTQNQPVQLPQSAPSTSYGGGVDGWFQVPQVQNGYQQGHQVSGHNTGPQLSPANPYYGGGGFGQVVQNGGAGYNPFMGGTVALAGNNPYQSPQQNQLQQQQLLQQQAQQQQAQQQQLQLQQAQQQQLQQQQAQQQQAQQQQLLQQQMQAQQQAQQEQQQQQFQQQQQQQQQQLLQQQQYLQSQLQPQPFLPAQNNPYQIPLTAPQPQPFLNAQGMPAQNNPYQIPLAAPQPNPYQSQLIQQRTGGVDKSAILALFNYPHLAPPPNSNPINLPQQENIVPNPGQMERSMSAPSAGSNNPFLPPTQGLPMSQSSANLGQPGRAGSVAGQGGRGHMSQESVDFGAWQSGRHSPDAFASLSFGQ